METSGYKNELHFTSDWDFYFSLLNPFFLSSSTSDTNCTLTNSKAAWEAKAQRDSIGDVLAEKAETAIVECNQHNNRQIS